MERCRKRPVHCFADSLAASHKAETLPFWEECYRRAFDPYFETMWSCRTNGEWQHTGVDRCVGLMNGEVIRIDEKVRWRDYNDICLEYVSNDRANTPGWVCKPLRANYIAYAIAPRGICYLLPVIQLQQAWRKHGESWIERAVQRESGYRLCPATNDTYTTLNVAVPVNTLFAAMGSALRVEFAAQNATC